MLDIVAMQKSFGKSTSPFFQKEGTGYSYKRHMTSTSVLQKLKHKTAILNLGQMPKRLFVAKTLFLSHEELPVS